jgi:threonine/homoserine/homoserine lactone efflux protein
MSADAITVLTALALYAAATMSPGPTFALISRLAVSGQRSAALGATLGLAIGATIYATLSLTGLALVITRIGWLATLVQVAGGCYLIYLGITAWLRSHEAGQGVQEQQRRFDGLRGLRMGAVVELSNPKGIAFFLSLFAVSVPAGTAFSAKLTILAGGFAIEVLWYSLVAILLSSPPVRRVYARFGRWIERFIGTLLAGFGIRLITEKL